MKETLVTYNTITDRRSKYAMHNEKGLFLNFFACQSWTRREAQTRHSTLSRCHSEGEALSGTEAWEMELKKRQLSALSCFSSDKMIFS
jgi:hypothetical protein